MGLNLVIWEKRKNTGLIILRALYDTLVTFSTVVAVIGQNLDEIVKKTFKRGRIFTFWHFSRNLEPKFQIGGP